MVAEEHTSRCLRLTEHVISMNPAHYTVWLYRFKIIQVLDIPIPDEIEWLNEVALSNLKNYQIWHHRQLLIDHYYPKITDDEEAVKKVGKSEIAFINQILEEDTKNYHVWSYRQDLVAKLGLFSMAELASTQNLIEDDVRNNSAWSHRFYIVFSDPSHSTKGASPMEHDPKIPESIIERELKYTRDKILLSPQNQSSWNYLKDEHRRGLCVSICARSRRGWGEGQQLARPRLVGGGLCGEGRPRESDALLQETGREMGSYQRGLLAVPHQPTPKEVMSCGMSRADQNCSCDEPGANDSVAG
jgi:Protein prenyltransferase alpha subunit repeat